MPQTPHFIFLGTSLSGLCPLSDCHCYPDKSLHLVWKLLLILLFATTTDHFQVLSNQIPLLPYRAPVTITVFPFINSPTLCHLGVFTVKHKCLKSTSQHPSVNGKSEDPQLLLYPQLPAYESLCREPFPE